MSKRLPPGRQNQEEQEISRPTKRRRTDGQRAAVDIDGTYSADGYFVPNVLPVGVSREQWIERQKQLAHQVIFDDLDEEQHIFQQPEQVTQPIQQTNFLDEVVMEQQADSEDYGADLSAILFGEENFFAGGQPPPHTVPPPPPVATPPPTPPFVEEEEFLPLNRGPEVYVDSPTFFPEFEEEERLTLQQENENVFIKYVFEGTEYEMLNQIGLQITLKQMKSLPLLQKFIKTANSSESDLVENFFNSEKKGVVFSEFTANLIRSGFFFVDDVTSDDPFDDVVVSNRNIVQHIVDKLKTHVEERNPAGESKGFIVIFCMIILTNAGLEWTTNYPDEINAVTDLLNPNLPYIFWSNNMTKNILYAIMGCILYYGDDMPTTINVSTDLIQRKMGYILPVALVEEFTKWLQTFLTTYHSTIEYNINFTTTLIPASILLRPEKNVPVVACKFPQELARLKSLFLPEKNGEHPFILCFKEGLRRLFIKHDDFDWNALYPIGALEHAPTITLLQKTFPVNVIVYHIYPSQNWNEIRLRQTYMADKKYDFHFFYHCNDWGLLTKNIHGTIAFLNHFGCQKCSHWVKSENEKEFIDKHWKACRKCVCGRCYKEGEAHPVTCGKKKKQWKYQKEKTLECELPEPQKEENYIQHNHHADFECIHPNEDGFIVDACGLYNAKNGKKDVVNRWHGKDALDNFFKYVVEHLEGVLWFFYGSKFDAQFILRYCIKNNIDIKKDKTMSKGNEVSVLALKTNKHKNSILLIKDLRKFLFGSLKKNCLAFEIDKKYIKKDFDHEKVKTWEDSEKHRKERDRYLKYDVLAQREVYLTFGRIIWEDYKLNVSDYMSLAQLAYAASTQNIAPGKLYKLSLEDERPFREAYFGGRIVMTKKYYFNEKYEEIISQKEYSDDFWNEILDWIVYLDKNSLYPTQLFEEEFPCGKATRCGGYGELRGKYLAETLIKDALDGNVRGSWAYKLVQVTITPPNTHYVAFLMTRDPNGLNQQTLEKIERKWYTGVEILEAVILGYTLECIHAYYSFPSHESLFKQFVKTVFDRRLEAKKKAEELGLKDGGPVDLVHKTIANGCTGKFGQRGFPEKTVIYIGQDEMNKVVMNQKTQIVWDEPKEKGILAIFQQEKNDIVSTPFCLPITVWILGYARTCMSRFMRLVRGYTRIQNVPFYGDTDSLLLLKSVILNVDPKEFGKALGQMKDEMPTSKIIGLIVLAPKTYMMLFLRKDDDGVIRLYTQLKCKGITHSSSPFLYHADYQVNQEQREKALEVLAFLENRATKNVVYPNVTLHDNFYITKFKTGEIEVTDRITWKNMLALSKKEADIIWVGGTMIRVLSRANNLKEMNIHLDYNQRSLIAEDWWDKGKRTVIEGHEMSLPIGFNKNDEILDLLDEMQGLLDF